MVQIDIEMPIYCSDCPCHNGENGRCNITGDSTYDKRPFDCPLKEVKLADLPSAQPERKKGKWIDKGDYCVCNQCGHTEQQFNGVELIPLHTPFCAICGAEMEKNDAEAEIH